MPPTGSLVTVVPPDENEYKAKVRQSRPPVSSSMLRYKTKHKKITFESSVREQCAIVGNAGTRRILFTEEENLPPSLSLPVPSG